MSREPDVPAFDRVERAALRDALHGGPDPAVPPACPRCGERLRLRPVAPPLEVSYVRRRVLVLCPACRRAAAIDLAGAGP